MSCTSKVCWVVGLQFCIIYSAKCRIYYSGVSVWYHLSGRDAEPEPEAEAPETESGSFFQIDPLMERGFGFLEGGEIQLSMNCPAPEATGRPSFWLLYCSTSDARELIRMTYSKVNLECQLVDDAVTRLHVPVDDYCRRERIFVNGSTRLSASLRYTHTKRMTGKHFYTVFMLQCPLVTGEVYNTSRRTMKSCQSTLLALNPGDTQLSSDEMPLPVIYTVITLIWACLLIIWFLNWVIYFKYSNRLHRLVSCAPVIKVILVAIILVWWMDVARTGRESASITLLRNFLGSIKDALFFITLLVLAEGWGIVRRDIKHYRWKSLVLLFAVFATSLMCVHWVHGYFMAFSVCCVVLIMYKSLKWTSHNIRLLRRRRRKLRRFIARHRLRCAPPGAGGATVESQLAAKLHLLRRLRIVAAAYSTAYAVGAALATFLLEHAHVRAAARELPELAACIATAYLLRLRDFGAYERVELVAPKADVAVMELPDVCDRRDGGAGGVVLAVPVAPAPAAVCRRAEKHTQTPRGGSRYWRTVWGGARGGATVARGGERGAAREM